MKKIISIFLAVLMLLTTLLCASCKKSTENGNGTAVNTAPNADSNAEETKGLFYTAGQEEIDKFGLDGYEFLMFARSIDSEWSVTDVVVEEDYNATNAVDSAVYRRQIELEEKFGFTMKMVLSADTYGKELENQLNAGECEYDIAFPMARRTTTMATSGQLYDLNKLEYFNVDSGAWNKTFCDNLAWKGRLYFAVGGISVTNAYNSIRCFMFNKQLASDLGFTPYQDVYDGTWTLEQLNVMATAAAKDLDGDGSMETTDRWGMTWQSAMSGEVLFYGCNELVVKNDADGTPQLSLGNERSYDVFEMIQMMIGNTNVYYQGVDDDIRDMFRSGNTLFFTEVINLLPMLRDVEQDFGLLPLPKYDENQADYIQYVDEWCPSPVVVPVMVQNPERSGFLIQLLAETGMEQIKPEYYDRTLSYMLVRDADSLSMLEIITDKFVLDSAVLYEWSSYRNPFKRAFSDGTGLSSLLGTYGNSIKNAIKTTGDAYEKIQ